MPAAITNAWTAKAIRAGSPRTQMSVQARFMGIADIFEALTAKDRPYKKGKTLTESLQILGKFKDNGHIDPDLFDVFMWEKVYLRNAPDVHGPAPDRCRRCGQGSGLRRPTRAIAARQPECRLDAVRTRPARILRYHSPRIRVAVCRRIGARRSNRWQGLLMTSLTCA